MDPLVSIITPAYNCERVLPESLESVKNQTYANWEHIIIDDDSKDNTREIIKRYAEADSRINPIFLQANGGTANARNIGIAAAKGKYTAFLDSDDLWKPEKLSRHIVYMEKNICDFTYSDYEIISYKGDFIKNIIAGEDRTDYIQLLKANRIGCLTAVIRSEIIKRELMPDMKHEDYATWLNILKKHVGYAHKIDGILASYRRSDDSVSSNKLRTVIWTWKIYRENQRMGFFRSLKQLAIFGFFTTVKYLKR